MKLLNRIKTLKNSIIIRIRRIALERFRSNQLLLGSIYLNMSFTVKLCISILVIFSILVLNINPKEGAPVWLVLMEAFAYLAMVAIVVFLTILRFKNKKAHREKLNHFNRESKRLNEEHEKLKKEYEKLKEEEASLKEKIEEK